MVYWPEKNTIADNLHTEGSIVIPTLSVLGCQASTKIQCGISDLTIVIPTLNSYDYSLVWLLLGLNSYDFFLNLQTFTTLN